MKARTASARFGSLLLGAALALGCDPQTQPQAPDKPAAPAATSPAAATYVGSPACGRCHAEALAAWQGSQHDLAMQPAEDATVLGDFDDAEFQARDELIRFSRRGEKFIVNLRGADGDPADFEVAYTFGVDPLQQYLIPQPGGRLQVLPVAWDARPAAAGGQRWFDVFPDESRPPGDPFHWTGVYQTWNHMCAECHSTHLEKRYDRASDSYATVWEELDVGCEACHGPGSAHAEVAAAGAAPVALVQPFARDEPRVEVERCAPCHARRRRVSAEDAHGRGFLDDFAPATLQPALYHADGQILDEVYVYGSFLQSRMYARGVRCSDCHDPHSVDLRSDGNALCTRCHSEAGDPRFSTLTKKLYDSEQHHFHPPGTPGAACVDCHMPARTYMEIDPRHDHGFRIPRPDLAEQTGAPDACTGCHADRGAEWAAAVIRERASVPARPHYGEILAAGRRGDSDAVLPLTTLAADATQPAIVRATALELLSTYGPGATAAALGATDDADPLVRALAARGLSLVPVEQRIAAGAPLLRDPVLAVRSEAARALGSAPANSLGAATRIALDRALEEYEAAQSAESDTPSGRFNLAIVAAQRADSDTAVANYEGALALDPDFLPARSNLAVLYSELGRSSDSERVLREGIARTPDQGELHYSLGLILAESGRIGAAAGHIGRAAELMPGRPRLHYNHGLALQRSERFEEAERALQRAVQLAPGDPEILYALVAFYAQRGRWDEALPGATALVEITGGAPEALGLLRQIQARGGAAPPPQ